VLAEAPSSQKPSWRPDLLCRNPALRWRMLTDKEAEEIRRGLAAGMRGPC